MSWNGALNLVDLRPSAQDFKMEILDGLARRPKRLPCKFFYDKEGSLLFDRICALPEYYPTRTETAILREHAGELAAAIGSGCLLVELGSGSSVKTRILLDHLEDPVAYVPVDITRRHLISSAHKLAREYPRIEVLPLCADYTCDFELPKPRIPPNRTVFFFPGSTIGNFQPEEAGHFLRGVRRLCEGGGLLIGVDLEKAPEIVEAAYNDSQGVTAEFNLNVLGRANRELGADFDLGAFVHHAFYNRLRGRIEMHLISTRSQQVRIGEDAVSFDAGEHVITEYSYKYRVADFQALARRAGFEPAHVWTDTGRLFSVHYFEA